MILGNKISEDFTGLLPVCGKLWFFSIHCLEQIFYVAQHESTGYDGTDQIHDDLTDHRTLRWHTEQTND